MSNTTPPRNTKTVENRITKIITNLDAIGKKDIELRAELRKLKLKRERLEREKKTLQSRTIQILRRESRKRKLNNELGPGFTSPSKHTYRGK
tara:strand:+ start:934 stop:1209 length:276 start_codon:yes stop_codon:yes gene_type:complete